MRKITEDFLKLCVASKYEWCILRKIDEIYAGIENDVDIFVRKKNFKDFYGAVTNFSGSNIKIIKKRFQPCGISILLQDLHSREFLKVDIVYDTTFLMFSIFSSDDVLKNIKKHEEYYVLDGFAANEISHRKEMIRGSMFNYFSRLMRGESLFGWFPRETYFFGYIVSAIKNSASKSGDFVVLVGPDGSGKTTIGDKFVKNAKERYFSAAFHHFSIAIFPRLAKLKKSDVKEPDYTLPNSGTNAPIQPAWKSLIYTIYYGTEMLIYTNIIIRRRLRLGQICVFDRYFHDYLFQRSYRKAPRLMVKSFLALSKWPNLVVYCYGDADKIVQRKNELSVDEVKTQQNMIEKDVVDFWDWLGVRVVKVDTCTQSVDDCLHVINSNLGVGDV